jgi:predicted alpha-1,2-mannosidase
VFSRLPYAAVFISLTALSGFAGEAAPVDAVNPMIGTNAHGHVYPGATVPFGMVQLSPDTRLDTWDGCSGYHYSDRAILGFSHTHLSGTGRGDLGDIRITPLSGKVLPVKDGYRLAFSHENEKAKPGYYSVIFNDPKIKAELTATARAGFHRYQFPEGPPIHLAFDLARGIRNRPAKCAFEAESNTVVSGFRRSRGWAADKTFYFVAKFSRPFDAVHVEVNGKPVAQDARQGKGTAVQAVLDFNDPTEPVLMKIGISATSVEGARKNLAAEIPGWDFDGTAAAAEKAWNDVLSKIDIKTDDPAVRQTFYTALYHACMAPTLFNDADGTYKGLDHKVHPNEGFQNYCTFSLWDTFRAEHPLLTIVQPQRVDDFVGSMLAHYRQFNQHCLPVWPLAGNETWCMIGIHSIPVIAEAYAKGFRRFDAEAAYQAMRDSMMQDRNYLNEYRKFGYIPTGKRKLSVSRSLEYAYDDWCVADMARRMGKTEDAKLFAERAANYRHLLNPANGFVQGKAADNKWREPFDPRTTTMNDFKEGTSWNYTWFVPQDVPGLIGLIGGDRKFIGKLDRMFTDQSGPQDKSLDLTGLIGQYVHGNEPCHHVAYLYNYAGAPWKTQARVRDIMKTLYSNKTDGICGNDDCGQMSAWYVLSALGFYPVSPASGVYVLGSPAMDRATIRLDPKYQKGHDFTIVADNNSPRNVYIQSATLNGKPLNRSWFTHEELTAGGELILKMGPEPNKDWAKEPADRPRR